MSRAPQFLSDLTATLVDDFAGLWRVADEPLRYYSAVLGLEIAVLVGFLTDFASGPSTFWVSLARDQGRKAAAVHDLLYTLGTLDPSCIERSTADAVLREALIASGYGATVAAMYWGAVRIGGRSHWAKDNLPQSPEVLAGLHALAAVLKAAKRPAPTPSDNGAPASPLLP